MEFHLSQYISLAILIVTILLFGYLAYLARSLKKTPLNIQLIQSRAETTVFGMIGILIIDYALTFPTQSSTKVFFFYGKTGIAIGTIIVAIALISFVFGKPKKIS